MVEQWIEAPCVTSSTLVLGKLCVFNSVAEYKFPKFVVRGSIPLRRVLKFQYYLKKRLKF
jgi:hypothetical protein